MDKGKRPMSSGLSRSERRDYQRLVEDERSIQRRNEEADLKAREEFEWNMFNNKMRKYTNRKNRRGKDWVPTEQEVADENEKYPEVKKLYRERHAHLCKDKYFTDEEYYEGMDALRQECNALQKKLDEREEAEWWAAWNADDQI